MSARRSLPPLVLGALLASCGRGGLPQVSVESAAIVRSNYDFIPEHWKEERLARLFREESFKDLTAPGELGLFRLATDWTHRQWEAGHPEPYPLCNAIDILREIRAGRTGGFCGQYAYVLADVLKSAGFFAVRYVELTRADGEGHFVVEAWSNEHRTWVVLDPYHDTWFRLRGSGAPASALAVRASLRGGAEVEAVLAATGGLPAGAPPPDTAAQAAFFRNVAVSLRSDLMRHTRPLTNGDRFDMFLYYRDEEAPPPWGGRIPYRNVTSRVEDIAYDCNGVRVEHAAEPGRVRLAFFTDGSTPNFKEFRTRTSPRGPWTAAPQTLTLEGRAGATTLWVAAVNQFNRIGVPNRIDVRW